MRPDAANPQAMGVAQQRTPALCPPDFDEVYGACWAHVWHSLRRFGVRPADVEDAAHEVFVVVHRRLPDFEVGRPIKPWLSGIAYRVASDFRRRAHARHEAPGQEGALAAAADDRPGADHLLAAEDARNLVQRALERLPLERRAIFVMHEIDETPAPEIAQVLELPVNTVWSRLRTARQEFAEAARRLRRGGLG